MCDLKQLLCSWKLENILPHLIDEEVDVETLKIIKKHHIKALLSGFPLGRLIRFEHNLEQWRFTIGKPVKHAAYDERNDLVFEELTDQHHFRSQPNKNFSKDAQPCINSPINLKEILMENKPEGPELLEMYDKNQTFSNPERSHLIDLIVNHHLRHNISFDLYESYDFENAILSLFPNEKLDYYRNSKQESEIYAKYLKAEAVYINNNKEASQISDNLTSHDLMSRSFNHKNKADDVQLVVRKASKNSVKEPDISLSDKSDNYTSAYPQPKEILLKTVYKNCKKFVKIFKPFLLKDFLTSACSIFNLRGRNNMCVVLNGCEISSDDFKNVIPQYYKLPRFNVELKKKDFKMEKITKEQLKLLIEEMEDHPNIARGVRSFGETKAKTLETWKRISEKLNSVGTAEKTPDEWQIMWIHFKAKLKMKIYRNKKKLDTTRDAPSREIRLTALEEAAADLLQLEQLINSQRNFEETRRNSNECEPQELEQDKELKQPDVKKESPA